MGHLIDSDWVISFLNGQQEAVDVAVGERYAGLRLQLRRSRAILADNDLWIAATALTHDLILVSRDRHFDRVPGLSL